MFWGVILNSLNRKDIFYMAELSCIIITFLFWFTILFSIPNDYVVILKFNVFNEGLFEFILIFIIGTLGFYSWCIKIKKYKKQLLGE